MSPLGKCPDCNYEPISASCVSCPKCGCREFIEKLGPKEERKCSTCFGGPYYFRCKDCGGTGKEWHFQIKDFRTGKIYWERNGYLSYIWKQVRKH